MVLEPDLRETGGKIAANRVGARRAFAPAFAAIFVRERPIRATEQIVPFRISSSAILHFNDRCFSRLERIFRLQRTFPLHSHSLIAALTCVSFAAIFGRQLKFSDVS
jgi:hypothetical protein